MAENITIQYDICNKYDKICSDICAGRFPSNRVCREGQPGCNKTLCQMAEETIRGNQLPEFILFLIYDSLAEESRRLPGRKQDRDEAQQLEYESIWHTAIPCRTIARSYASTNRFLNMLKESIQKSGKQFPKGGDIDKAVTHVCKRLQKRASFCLTQGILEYIFESPIRPYFFQLQKQGTLFVSDARSHMPPDTRDIEKSMAIRQEYLKTILEAARRSGNTSYKDTRLESYLKYKGKQAEKAKTGKQAQYRKRLEKFCRDEEKKGMTNALQGMLSRQDKKTADAGTCALIAVLKKLDGDPKRLTGFRFRTNTGFSARKTDAKMFFTEESIQEGKDALASHPEVLAVEDIRLW